MPVGRVQVPQPFGQKTQYGQTGNLYYQVPGRPSSDTRLIQQPLQDASRATIQPQLVAKIDEITAYGPPWLFLTTEEKQQQQDEGPLAVRRASKGKPRSQSVPAGFSFKSPRLAPYHMSTGSPRSSFRHALYPASYPVKRTLLSSDWMGPPDLGHELTRSPSRRGSDQRRTSEDTISTGGHRKGFNIVEKSLSQNSKQLKTLEIDQDRGRDLLEDILAMDKYQRKRVTDLTIGRENVGVIRFKHPVDFTGIDLESLLGGLVILESRSATVYPDSFGLKPPPGEGLNVPASISLESSWTRKKTKGEVPQPVNTTRSVYKQMIQAFVHEIKWLVYVYTIFTFDRFHRIVILNECHVDIDIDTKEVHFYRLDAMLTYPLSYVEPPVRSQQGVIAN
ncbi:nucleoporin autopeptidase-domain-containing protein [Fusarium oxysporum f. sp. albedinis]|nr:nucleoporin autopeptidase-domain-containing protein [Fusarium oxysporum f. sp. albedinis]